eukprot:6213356-Pleurochrysis_carterae.AAC.1
MGILPLLVEAPACLPRGAQPSQRGVFASAGAIGENMGRDRTLPGGAQEAAAQQRSVGKHLGQLQPLQPIQPFKRDDEKASSAVRPLYDQIGVVESAIKQMLSQEQTRGAT